MSIGAITYGTPVHLGGVDPLLQPTIPGSANASDVLLALIIIKATGMTVAETGAGAWTEIFDESLANGCHALYYAAGDETTAPALQVTGTSGVASALVIRVAGALTGGSPIGTLGTGFTAGSSDLTVGPIADPTPLAVSDGVVFCFARQGYSSNTTASSSSISANSTGTWVNGVDMFTAIGTDQSSSVWHNIYTSAPTLADETATFVGGTASANQSGKMFEIKAAVAVAAGAPIFGKGEGIHSTLFGGRILR